MSRNRAILRSVVVIFAGLIAIGGIVLGWSQAGAVSSPGITAISGIVMLVGLYFARPIPTPAVDAIQNERDQLDVERAELVELRKTIESQLEVQAQAINEREMGLSNRLVAFQEWLEYPGAEAAVDGVAATPSLETAELTDCDQRVIELLDAEAKRLYEKLQEGYYQPDGQLDSKLIRDDVLDLVTRVAKVYRPDAGNPLLETSVDDLLRAGSRVCLHLLITLERLPFDLKDASFATLHGYVQKAVKAYGIYTAAEPYLGYASKALYVGRMASGANPLTLGITWALTEIGKRGAKAIGQKLVDQQAISMLGDLVRVVGFEVASVYGGDFRHRDSNWVYGSELTNLMSRFPISRENLAHALREVGALTLRNEYDRVFLYRCLSTHRTAEPLVDAHSLLDPEQRQDIAHRLEKFFRDFVHGRKAERVAEWSEGVETRLGFRLDVAADEAASGSLDRQQQENASALESLAALVCTVKGRPVRELREHFDKLALVERIGASAAEGMLVDLENRPPHFFDPPDIDPDSETLGIYMSDLCRLAVCVPPFDVHPDDVVLETAAYFGRDIAKERANLDRQYVDLLNTRLAGAAASTRVSGSAARALLTASAGDDPITVLYADVKVSWPGDYSMPQGKVWFAGSRSQLVLAIESDRDWSTTSSPSGFSAEKIEGMIIDDCQLRGGAWILPGQTEPIVLEITIEGAKLKRYDSWFAPLFELIRSGSTS